MWKRSITSGEVKSAVAIAAAVNAFVLVMDLVLTPLYQRGHAQGFLSVLNGASMLLALPGLLIAIETGVRQGHHTLIGAWWFILGVNFVLWVLAGVVVFRAWGLATHYVKRWWQRDQADVEPEVNLLRRRALVAGAGVLVTGAAGYTLGVSSRRYELTRRTVSIRDLPVSLEGLRIVQITDVHHGPSIPLSHVQRLVTAVNALEADVIVLTGDYVHRSAHYIEPVVATLGALRARIGVLAVLGNHDWWESVARSRLAFASAGIPLIDNSRRFITPDRRLITDSSEGLCIAGVGDYYEDEQRYDDALAGVPDRLPRLLLSHNPDVAEDARFIACGHRVDLMLSGHTHGGQIYVPGLGTPVVPSRYGQKYATGLVQGPVCPVYICRGVGLTVLPLRLGVPPEVALLTLAGER